MDKGKKMKVENEVNKNQQNAEHKVPSDNNTMAISKVDPGNQSQVNEPANIKICTPKPYSKVGGDQSEIRGNSNGQSLSQKAAGTSEMNLMNIPPDQTVQQPRFGRKRPLSQSIAESQMQLSNVSVIQSLGSQPSQQVSSEWDGDYRSCKEYKVEIKRLLGTNKRITREAEAAKQRMDNILATALKGQETQQKELTLLRRNSERQHNELTALKALMREIQGAIGRYKF